MNNSLSVGGILCDLEKGFYCVNHGIIVDKLEFSGISGKILNLYKINSEVDNKMYRLVHLILMIVILLDGKSYKCGSSTFDLGFIISYLY
jgi:hypothetical protein